MRLVIIVLLVLVSNEIGALDFKPFPSANISVDQWQDYRNKVVETCGEPQQIVAEQKLEKFQCAELGVNLAFTQQGHPAHPAWIARQPVQTGDGIHIRTIGYFAGLEPPFAELFKQYLELNEKIKSDFETKNTAQ
ncbi:hypothetical protein HPT27_03495 [Permianibacter sp. IMCC34836]|uniref:hypothetical protein n=1 Tax=Permianibacter fluminis TaxID=2738515 RepID=UPI001554889F|nr:hypothetical protein [Permianibacter fluminis]NQD36074.1 hypothetical protein [Permianibacter fluminis]